MLAEVRRASAAPLERCYMNVEMRTGTAKDSDQILEAMCKAFHHDESSSRYATLKALAKNDAESFQVLAAHGRVIAVVRVCAQNLRTGLGAVVKGDVGHVSVHPDFQGKGHGSALMRHCVKWMRENGFDISRLGGLARFYSRFGWERFPRRYVDFVIKEVKAGASILSPQEVYRLPDDYPGELRPYDDARDRLGRWEVSELFNGNRPGSLVVARPKTPAARKSQTEPNPLQMVYERDGRILGFVSATEYPEDVTPFEAKITIGDFAYDLDVPLAAELLLKHILLTAYERQVLRVSARIPFDPRVISAIRDAGISADLKELHSSVASNMIQVINLASTFEHLRPDLEARLASGAFRDWDGEFIFAVGGRQEAVLQATHGAVYVTQEALSDARLDLSHADLVALIFGIRSFEELPAAHSFDLDPQERGVLCALFPRQAAASGPWG